MSKTKSLKRNVIFNIIKQVLKIAFPLITFPYVSRILLEDNLGKYNFTLSVISYFTLIAGLGISSYAVREGARIRDDKAACNQFANEVFTINLFTTGLAYVLLVLTCLVWTKLQGYRSLLFVQSLPILFTTLGADWVNGIYEDYEYMTKRYIFVKLLSLIFIFLLVKKRDDYLIYTGIVVGSEILANILNIFYIRKYLSVRPIRKWNIKRHILPLLVLFANAIAITIYCNADITMIGIFKNDADVGIYSVASKMYSIAKNLINAIIVVTIPRLAALLGKNDPEAYNSLLGKTLKCVSLFMFPIIVGMMMLSKECIIILGGENFLSGQTALIILSVALLPASINSIFFDGILIVNRREKSCLIATTVSAVINILLNIFFIPWLRINGAAITTLIAESVCCILSVIFSRHYHHMKISLDKDYLSIVLGCLCIVAACIGFSCIDSFVLRIFLSVAVSMVMYLAILIFMKNTTVISLWNGIRKKILPRHQ